MGQILTKAVAERIIERKKELLRGIGITEPAKIEDILTETYEEYSKYKKAKRLRKKGMPYKKIAEKTGLDKFKVFSWTKKDRLPRLFSDERFFSKNLLRIDESTEDDVIKLLAVYSSSKISSKQTKFKTKFSNRENLEMVLDSFFNVFSTVPYIWEDEHGVEFDFCSKPFLEYFNEQTRNNTRVPLHLLKTREQKEMYFQYFFLRKGFIRYKDSKNPYDGLLVFSFDNNEELLFDFAVLLSDIGLSPTISSTLVNISDSTSLRQVAELCLCSDKKKKLNKIIIGKIITPEVYQRIVSGSEIYFEKNKGELAQEYDLAAWVNFAYADDIKKEPQSELFYQEEKYILADHIFNMYVPDRFLDQPARIKTRQLQIYKVLRSNPRFFQFTILDDNSFYIEKDKLDLVESLIGSMYRKERRFNDAVKLTERL